jgi:hypothetical protein
MKKGVIVVNQKKNYINIIHFGHLPLLEIGYITNQWSIGHPPLFEKLPHNDQNGHKYYANSQNAGFYN